MSNYQINQAKWEQRSIITQMANIGSEVGRAFQAQRQHQLGRAGSAVERALDLFSATAEALASKKSPQLKEVLRAKEEFLSHFFPGSYSCQTDTRQLEKYFHQFALAERG
jgi:hypothetical protein